MNKLVKRAVMPVIALLLALVLAPKLITQVNAAARSVTYTVDGLTYTFTLTKFVYGVDYLDRVSKIEIVSLTRNGNSLEPRIKVSYTNNKNEENYFSRNYSAFTDQDCTSALSTMTMFDVPQQKLFFEFQVTRPAGTHTGATSCASPNCTRCGIAYIAHDYSYTGDATHHWQVCKNDSSHTTEKQAHTGGNPTCITPAVCSVCNASYTIGHVYDTTKWEWENGYHYHPCKTPGCTARSEVGTCSYCQATCTTASVCSTCGHEKAPIDPNGHNWSDYQSDGTQHWRVCQNDSTHTTSKELCSGGTATCNAPATCATCGNTYGKKLEHSLHYSKELGVKETCLHNCGHEETALMFFSAATFPYTGSPIEPAWMRYSDGWLGDRSAAFVYQNNINAGQGSVSITVEGITLQGDFQITPVEPDSAELNPASKAYTGQPLTTEANVRWNGQTLEAGRDYDVVVDTMVTPGAYTVKIVGKNNFTGTIEKTFTVTNAALTDVAVQAQELTYTSQPLIPVVNTQAVAAGGQSVSFTYSMASVGIYGTLPILPGAGTYTVYYQAAAPYHDTASGSFTVKVNQAANDWETTPALADWTYGQTASTPAAQAKFGDVTVRYTGTANDGSTWDSVQAPTLAGQYQAIFTVAETENYAGLSETVDFTLQKADYDLSGAKWDYTGAFTYDGSEKSVAVTGLPAQVRVVGYSGEKASAKGSYTAQVILAGEDIHNYNVPVMEDLNWRIKAALILRPGGAPDTGDGAQLLLWIGMALFGLMSFAALIFGKKRQRT